MLDEGVLGSEIDLSRLNLALLSRFASLSPSLDVLLLLVHDGQCIVSGRQTTLCASHLLSVPFMTFTGVAHAVVQSVLDTHVTEHVEDVQNSSYNGDTHFVNQKIVSAVAAPILHGDDICAVVYLESAAVALTTAAVRELESICQRMAFPLHNALYVKSLEHKVARLTQVLDLTEEAMLVLRWNRLNDSLVASECNDALCLLLSTTAEQIVDHRLPDMLDGALSSSDLRSLVLLCCKTGTKPQSFSLQTTLLTGEDVEFDVEVLPLVAQAMPVAETLCDCATNVVTLRFKCVVSIPSEKSLDSIEPLRVTVFGPEGSGSGNNSRRPSLNLVSSSSSLLARQPPLSARTPRSLTSSKGSGSKTSRLSNRAMTLSVQKFMNKRFGFVREAASSSREDSTPASLADGEYWQAREGVVLPLPRGGLYVKTKNGPVQFGIPPETIKDSLKLGEVVPTNLVIPSVKFDLHRGLNVAELEFPGYFNFFVLQKQVNMITTPEGEAAVRNIMTELLICPQDIFITEEYGTMPDPARWAARPDLLAENEFFRRPRNGREITVDSMYRFTHFDDAGVATLDDGVRIIRSEGTFVVEEDGEVIAKVPVDIRLPGPEKLLADIPDSVFDIPSFGVTVLGSSHGFDANGTTSGFVLWMNGLGIMVDPPPHSTALLERSGISPRLITAVILTHCHADHAAGTLQKVLEENRITILTTQTIMTSFVKTYALTTELDEQFLSSLFEFRPVSLGRPMLIHGGRLQFFYSFHSIPCVGFEAYFGGKSFYYSADTCFDETLINTLTEEGVLSNNRRDFLLNLPWHHDVILHEAGVPPTHTPVTSFANLSDEVKDRLYLIHISEKDVLSTGLKYARVGVEHTIRIPVTDVAHLEHVQALEVVASMSMFRSLHIVETLRLMEVCRKHSFSKGSVILHKDEPVEMLVVVLSGRVTNDTTGEVMTTGECPGLSLLLSGELCEEQHTAASEVCALVLDLDSFYYIFEGSEAGIKAFQRVQQFVAMKRQPAFEALNLNPILKDMSAVQKVELQSLMHQEEVVAGQVLWTEGEQATRSVLVFSGQVALQSGLPGQDTVVGPGSFVASVNLLLCGGTEPQSLVVQEAGVIFLVFRDDLIFFLDSNPSLLLLLLKRGSSAMISSS